MRNDMEVFSKKTVLTSIFTSLVVAAAFTWWYASRETIPMLNEMIGEVFFTSAAAVFMLCMIVSFVYQNNHLHDH